MHKNVNHCSIFIVFIVSMLITSQKLSKQSNILDPTAIFFQSIRRFLKIFPEYSLKSFNQNIYLRITN